MEHLKGMGEQMASLNRQYSVGQDTFLSMASIYHGDTFSFFSNYFTYKQLMNLIVQTNTETAKAE